MNPFLKLVCCIGMSVFLACCGSSPAGPAESATLSISPMMTSVLAGATQTFTAALSSGDRPQPIWSVVERDGGIIDRKTGLYQAPSRGGTFHVMARSLVGSGETATAAVQVSSPSILIMPVASDLLANSRLQLIAQVSGAVDTAVNWSVGEATGCGTITASGNYTAPAQAATCHLVATSDLDPAVTARVSLDIFVGSVAVVVSPAAATSPAGATLKFAAAVSGAPSQQVSWLVQETAGGSIDATGLYTAPVHGGIFHLAATSIVAPASIGFATVEVTPVSIQIATTPGSAVAVGDQLMLSASASGGVDNRLSWSVQESSGCGSVTPQGLFSAPSAPATCHLVATGVLDNSASASVAITVVAPGVTLQVNPDSNPVVADGIDTWSIAITAISVPGVPVAGQEVVLTGSDGLFFSGGGHYRVGATGDPAMEAFSGVTDATGTLRTRVSSSTVQTASLTATLCGVLPCRSSSPSAHAGVAFVQPPWVPVDQGLFGGSGYSVAFDRNDPGTVYLGTSNGVFKSLDRGASWTAANVGLAGTPGPVFDVAAAPDNPSLLLAGGSCAVYRSTDGGATWSTAVSYTEATCSSTQLLFDPRVPGLVLAVIGTVPVTVVVSDDDGAHWSVAPQAAGAGPAACQTTPLLGADPTSRPSIFYAGCFIDQRLWSSSDSGATWAALTPPPTGTGWMGQLFSLAVDPVDGTVFLGGAGLPLLFASRDHGSTWDSIGSVQKGYSGLGGYPPIAKAIAFDPADHTNLNVASTRGGLLRTTGPGALAASQSGLAAPELSVLTLDSAAPSNLYAVLDASVVHSADSGASWERLPPVRPDIVIASEVVYDLAIDAAGVAATGGGLYASSNSSPGLSRYRPGNGWAVVASIPTKQVEGLAADPELSGVLTVVGVHPGVSGGALFRTTDAGATFSALTTPGPVGAVWAASNPSCLYFITAEAEGRVYRSLDAGASWTLVAQSMGSPLKIVEVDLHHSDTVYFQTIDLVNSFTVHAFRSRDGLLTSVEIAPPKLPNSSWIDFGLWADPSIPSALFLATGSPNDTPLWRSGDAGATWAPAAQGIGRGQVTAMAFTPSPGAAYAAVPGRGVFKLAQGGQ